MGTPSGILKDRVALITGAARGIGLGIARGLHAAGARVVIQDIDIDAAKRSVEGAQGLPGALAIGGDINDLTLAQQLVDATTQHFGGLHIIVNNASIQVERPWPDESPEDMLVQYRANVVFPNELIKSSAAILRSQKFGRIVNIGSIQQKVPNCHMLGYGLTKSALTGLTLAMSREFVKDGVTVNLVAPGYFNTYRNASQFPDEQAEARIGQKHVPMGRVGRPSDVAGIVVSLCSDACGYITGQTIYVDGGMSVS